MTVNASLNRKTARPGLDLRVWMVIGLGVLAIGVAIIFLNGWLGPVSNRAAMAGSVKATAPLRQAAYEESMERRVTGLLATIYGVENVRVTLQANIDYAERQTITEKYDPDSQVARSSSNRSGGGNLGVSDTEPPSEENIAYEISKSTSTVIEDVGTIRKLSAAILINSETNTALPEQAQTIEPLIRTAIGFDERRGDRLEIAYLPFSSIAENPQGTLAQGFSQNLNALIVAGLASGVLVMLIFYGWRRKIRSHLPSNSDHRTISKSNRDLPKANGNPGVTMAPDITIDPELSTSELRSHVAQLVDQNPDRALAIMRSWLQEGKDQGTRQ